MQFFKHMCKLRDSEAGVELRDHFGTHGYGAMVMIMEVLADYLDEKNKTFQRFSAKKWKEFHGFSPKKFKKFAEICEKNEIFYFEFEQEGAIEFITINCPKLLVYRDKKSIKTITEEGKKTEKSAKKEGEKEQENDATLLYKNKEVKNIRIKDKNNNPPSPPSGGECDSGKKSGSVSEKSECEIKPIEKPKPEPKPKPKPKPKFSPEHRALAEQMSGRVLARWPSTKINLDGWAEEIRKLTEIDKYHPDEIIKVWNWADSHQNGDFSWGDQIRTPAKLRERNKDKIKYFELIQNLMERANAKPNQPYQQNSIQYQRAAVAEQLANPNLALQRLIGGASEASGGVPVSQTWDDLPE